MISAFALCAVLGQSTTISFNEPAAPLKRLMPRLAEACHTPIKVSKAMDNDVVCIAVHDVSSKELLEKVASATGGRWYTEHDGVTLEPDEAERAALTRKGVQKRSKRIKADIDVFNEPDTGLDNLISPSSRYEWQLLVEEEKFVNKLLSAVGTDKIAALPLGSRTVWSTSPNNNQLDLNCDLSSDINELVAIQNQLNEANRKEAAARNVQSLLNRTGTSPLTKMDMILTVSYLERGKSEPEIEVQFKIFDGKGIIQSQNANTIDSGGPMPGWRWKNPPKKIRQIAVDDPAIRLTPQSDAFRKFISTDDSRKTKAAWAEAAKLLEHPDEIDPLSYPAELLSGAAKLKNMQLVASLPDTAFQWFPVSAQVVTGSDLADCLAKDPNVAVESDDHWMTVSRTHFDTPMIDREAVAKLVDQFIGKTDFTLANLATVAKGGYGPANGTFINQWLSVACPALSGLTDRENWQFLKFCAQLEPQQLEGIINGNQLSVGELSPEAKATATQLVIGYTSSHWWDEIVINPPWMGSAGLDDYRYEPTELIPNGLTGSASISTFVMTTLDIVRPAVQQDLSFEQETSLAGLAPEELGWRAADIHRSDTGEKIVSVDFDRELSIFKQVQMGRRRDYEFHLNIGEGAARKLKISLPEFTDQRSYAIKDLPEDLRTRFESTAASLKADAHEEMDQQARGQVARP